MPGNASSLPAIDELWTRCPDRGFLELSIVNVASPTADDEYLHPIAELAPDETATMVWAFAEWQSFDWSSWARLLGERRVSPRNPTGDTEWTWVTSRQTSVDDSSEGLAERVRRKWPTR